MEIIKKFEPLFGEWYAESFIGAGSFGRVYKIYREELGNKFYSALKYISIPSDTSEIKQLRTDGMDDASISTYYGTLARDISSETTLMNQLRGNTNIVSFEDSRIVPKPNGIGYDIFIRMELLENLTNRMVDLPLTQAETVKLGQDICSALVLCRKKGIIHRDIKPDNIFISEDGDFKLGDFGIARQLDKTATFMSKKGTYNYMAPEVYKGEKYGTTCDLYSLGLVMYRLLNKGRLPFLPAAPKPITANDKEIAMQHRFKGDALPAPCNADEELANIILKACAFDANDRFATAEEMKEALIRYSNNENGIVPVVPVIELDLSYDDTDDTKGIFRKGNYDKITDGTDPNATSGVFTRSVKSIGKIERVDDCEKTHGEVSKTAIPISAETGKKTHSVETLENATATSEKSKSEETAKKHSGLIIGIAAALLSAFGLMAVLGVFGKKKLDATKDTNSDAEIESTSIAATDDLHTTEPITESPSDIATENPIVVFSDYAFEEAVKEALGLSGEIRLSEIESIDRILLAGKRIDSISDIALFSNLKYADLSKNNIGDLSPLSQLTQLTELNLSENKVKDIDALDSLSSLVSLDLSKNKVQDISPLSGLKHLEHLDLNGNPISDINVVSSLQVLKWLGLSKCGISNIDALSSLINLQHLELAENSIVDISPLENLVLLSHLDLDSNRVEDITPIGGLIGLKVLWLDDDKIKDINVLKDLTNLNELGLGSNPISDFSAIEQLHNLKTLWLTTLGLEDISFLSELTELNKLYMWENNITDISALSQLTKLNVINLSNNRIKSVKDLSGLAKLEKLTIGYNKIKDATPLQELAGLKELYLYGNPLSNAEEQLQILKDALPECDIRWHK